LEEEMSRDAVTQMITSWIAESPSRSLKALSKKTGLGDSTLRRAHSGEGVPELDTIIDIGKATSKRGLMLEAIRTYYPNCVDVIEKGKIAEEKALESDTSEFFETGMSTKLLLTLFSRKRLIRSQVSETYGTVGLKIVDRFMELGIASETLDGQIRPSRDWYNYSSVDELLKAQLNILRDFDKDQIGSSTARIALQTEALSKEDAEKVQKVIGDAIVEIRAIMDAAKEPGEHVICVSMLMQAIQ
jgi:DNA-binding phage protein